MFIDGIQLAEGSKIENLTVISGSDFPLNPTLGELFVKTGEGLHTYTVSGWIKLGEYVEPIVISGTDFPTSPVTGQVFLKTGVGLHTYDGTDWVRMAEYSAPVSEPMDISGSIIGKPSSDAVVARHIAVRAFSIPTNLTGSFAKCDTAPTSSQVLTVAKNGTSIGTITFSASQTTGVFSTTATSFAIGDTLTIKNQAVQDATFANAGFTLVTTLI